ncbi:BSD domain-containing protein 1 [Sarcoptes scabiei]|uniref:BSD domain-containing protein 1 n=1 Tax=Sarcoptes scabiei TaxID=52283 RepID=A0A132ADL9_SARSC|nr:BSD domain-containing protein 1 [Sarcoptes scabiei]KPM09081.1 synapse-associated protein-like protein [Sarcoptes scabiei]
MTDTQQLDESKLSRQQSPSHQSDKTESIDESKKDDSSESSPNLTGEIVHNEANYAGTLSGWISSFVQSAKQTVNQTTMESIRRDFNELKDVVQHDTTNMISSTASFVKNTLNEIGNSVNEISSLGTDEHLLVNETKAQSTSIENEIEHARRDSESKNPSSTLPFDLKTLESWTNRLTGTAKHTISKVKDTLVDSVFANFSVDELSEEPYVLKDGEMIKIENWPQFLHELQINPDTYCREPSGIPEDFEHWLVRFNLLNYQKQMSYLLETVPELKKYHDDLVPNTLSENCFWHRYFYQVHRLKEQQANLIKTNRSINDQEMVTLQSSTKSNVIKKEIDSNDSVKESSQSSTDDWEPMGTDGDRKELSKEKNDSKYSSSDEEKEWVKCD